MPSSETLEWDYPRRVLGDGREPCSIPYEIYEEIFLYFDPRPERFDHNNSIGPFYCKQVLFNLSCTCRLFRVIVLPFIFHNITIVTHKDHPHAAKIYTFCEELVQVHDSQSSSPTSRYPRCIAPYVKECHLLGSKADMQNDGHPSVHLRALSHFRNLQTLHLQKTPINRDLFGTVLPKLKNLTNLVLDNHGIHSEEELRGLSTYSFVRLHVGESDSRYRDQSLCSHFSTEHLEEIETNGHHIFETLADKGPMHALQVLRITPSERSPLSTPGLFCSLLAHAPNLVELRLGNIIVLGPLPREGSISLLNLAHLSCPDQMIPLFSFSVTEPALRELHLYPSFRDTRENMIPPPICYTVLPGHIAACMIELKIPYVWLVGHYKDEDGDLYTYAPHFDQYFPRLEVLSVYDHAHTRNEHTLFKKDPARHHKYKKDLFARIIKICQGFRNLREMNIFVDKCYFLKQHRSSRGPDIPWNLPLQLQTVRSSLNSLTNPFLCNVSFTPQVRWTRVGYEATPAEDDTEDDERGHSYHTGAGKKSQTLRIGQLDMDAKAFGVQNETEETATEAMDPGDSEWIPHVPYPARYVVREVIWSGRPFVDHQRCFERVRKGLW